MVVVDVLVRNKVYCGLHVPDGCTVAAFKELLGKGPTGFLRDRVLYVERLRCRLAVSQEEYLLDDALLPQPPEKVCVEGPAAVLQMLEIALRKMLGPPMSLDEHAETKLDTHITKVVKGEAVSVTLRGALTGEVLATVRLQPWESMIELVQGVAHMGGGPHMTTKLLHGDRLLHEHEIQENVALPKGACVDVFFRARSIVTGSADGTAKVWFGRDCSITLVGHSDIVRSVTFSRDGSTILTASSDSAVRLWCVENGETFRILYTPGAVFSAAFSPNDLVIAAGCGSQVILWSLLVGDDANLHDPLCDKGHTLIPCVPGIDTVFPRHSCDLCGSGSICAPDTVFRCSLCNYDLCESCYEVPKEVIRAHSKQVHSVAWSLDGALLASGSADGTAKLWDLPYICEHGGGRPIVLKGHHGAVRAASFSPDSEHVVTCAWDRTAKVWITTTGECVLNLLGHHSDIFHASFSPDGQLILTASADGSARLWRANDGECVWTLSDQEDALHSAAFSSDGRAIATAGGDTAKVWDVASGICSFMLIGHADKVYSIGFSTT